MVYLKFSAYSNIHLKLSAKCNLEFSFRMVCMCGACVRGGNLLRTKCDNVRYDTHISSVKVHGFFRQENSVSSATK